MRNFRLCSEVRWRHQPSMYAPLHTMPPENMLSLSMMVQGAELPPFQSTILLQGDTMDGRGTKVLPQVQLSTMALVFPPCLLPGKSHVTLTMCNHGATPVQFCINQIHLPNEFAFVPMSGVVSPQETAVIAAQYSPTSSKPLDGKVQFVLNGNTTESPWLPVSGSATRVSVELSAATLLCKPTCIGASSARAFKMTNKSCLPAAFGWELPNDLADAFKIEPHCGILPGDAAIDLCCTFTPKQDGKVCGDARCHLEGGITAEVSAAFPSGCPPGILSKAGQDHTLQLQITGLAAEALVTMQPAQDKFGQIVVGQLVHVPLTLCNGSNGAVKYAISALGNTGQPQAVVEWKPGTEHKEPHNVAEGVWVSAERLQGVMAGRATEVLDLYFKAYSRMAVSFTVVCTYGETLTQAGLDEYSPKVRLLVFEQARQYAGRHVVLHNHCAALQGCTPCRRCARFLRKQVIPRSRLWTPPVWSCPGTSCGICSCYPN
jgi:hypothetical protein